MVLSSGFLNANTIESPFYGKQSHCSIWNIKLSSAQVLELYDNYNNNGGLANSTYELSTYSAYANVVKYFKREDVIDVTNNLAVDSKNTSQKMKWLPIANWTTTQLYGSYNTLPSSSDLFTRKIWETTTAGVFAFNHFSRIYEFNQRLFIMWMCHSHDEHGCGQFIRYSYSDDFGDTWSSADTLFPQMADMIRDTGSNIRFLMPIGFCEISGDLYAVAEVNDTGDLSGGYVGATARKINTNGTLGDINVVWTYDGSNVITGKTGYPTYTYDGTNWNAIKTWFTTSGKRPASHGSTGAILESRITTSGAISLSGTLIEQFELTMPYGSNFRIWRQLSGGITGTDYYYTQYSRDGTTWYAPIKGNIPYPVTMGAIKQVGLNKIILVGNPHKDPALEIRSPLLMAVCGPDLQFLPQNIYNIRTGGSANRFEGSSKNGAYAYPDYIIMSNGRLGISYTTFGKEDIEFSSLIIPDYIG